MAKQLVQHRKFRSYSGPVIKGTIPFSIDPGETRHVARAFWLTAKVETGAKFGGIMAADGTGMTAGLDQHIAVYPKQLAHEDFDAENDQGSLWQLLRRMETVDTTHIDLPSKDDVEYRRALNRLWAKLKGEGWYVAQDGVLRYWQTKTVKRRSYEHDAEAGDAVYGFEIRDVLTPFGGKVLKGSDGWTLAKEWAWAFHDLFKNPAGFKAQQHFGEEHLVARTKRRRRWPGNTSSGLLSSVEKLIYPADVTVLEVMEGSDSGPFLSPELDLALCMYQSHSVNAPGKANRLVAEVYRRTNPEARLLFAEKLIHKLGTSSFGRWDDDIKYGRYQRTRSAARASGLWPRRLFDGPKAIMPKDLKG